MPSMFRAKLKIVAATPFSDFIRNASSAEKKRVYAKVMKKATVPAQRSQGCRMCGAVSTDEAALLRHAGHLSVHQMGSRHRQHAPHLGVVARLDLELADSHQIIQRCQAHEHRPLGEGWAGPERG